jgi:hypothetical protein
MGVLLVLLPGRYTVTASVSSDFDGDGTREVSATSYVIDVTVRRDRHR